MRKLQKKMEQKNSDLIKSFISIQDHPENYEVWVPYFHRGIVGFIDLIIDSGSEISIFKFAEKAKEIEKVVKSLKLESSVYPKSRNITSKDINPYLVIKDGEKNRKTILSQETLLSKQPFDLLFIDKERRRVESIFELRDSLPRLFQTRNIRLDDDALDYLITKPNHSRIESAIVGLEDPPDIITKEFLQKIERYLRKNEEPPEDTDSLREYLSKRRTETYRTGSEESSVKKAKQS